MQTFLPYPDPRASAAVLDDRRLGKQRVETFQVLRALTWPQYGWKHHPVVKMWRGFVPALVSYGLACVDEWRARGRADATRTALLEFTGGDEPEWNDLHDAGALPPWVGDEALHLSHRSALVRKEPEHYRPLFADVPDDLPYVWPDPAFPRWPLRRGSDRPFELAEALPLLGLDKPPPGAADVVATPARRGRRAAPRSRRRLDPRAARRPLHPRHDAVGRRPPLPPAQHLGTGAPRGHRRRLGVDRPPALERRPARHGGGGRRRGRVPLRAPRRGDPHAGGCRGRRPGGDAGIRRPGSQDRAAAAGPALTDQRRAAQMVGSHAATPARHPSCWVTEPLATPWMPRPRRG